MSGFGIPGIASSDTLPGVFLEVVEFYLFFMVFGVLFWWFGRSEFVNDVIINIPDQMLN
jgi:hypothetical protein